jgi:hypothetical protein
LVEERKNGDFVWDGEVQPAEMEGSRGLNGGRKLVREDFKGELAPVKPGSGKGGFLHHTGGVLGDGGAEEGNEVGAIGVGHRIQVNWLIRLIE